MNNPKLTNVLIIALIAVNCFLLMGVMFNRHHRHHHGYMAGRFGMRHGMHWASRHHRFRMHGSFHSFHNDNWREKEHAGI